MKLNFQGMQILMEELQQQEMWAIYLMVHGKEMTEVVSKLNLTRIICVLCQKLNWIEEDMESDDCPNKADEKIVETPSNFSTQGNLNHVYTKPDESVERSADPLQISKKSSEDQFVNKSAVDRNSSDLKSHKRIQNNEKTFSCSKHGSME